MVARGVEYPSSATTGVASLTRLAERAEEGLLGEAVARRLAAARVKGGCEVKGSRIGSSDIVQEDKEARDEKARNRLPEHVFLRESRSKQLVAEQLVSQRKAGTRLVQVILHKRYVTALFCHSGGSSGGG